MSENKKRWSHEVNRKSDALDLEEEVFKKKDPHEIAVSLKESAEKNNRKKSSSYRSALSMLNLYINRAGDNLSKSRRQTLERAKKELRKVFDRAA